MAQRSIRGPSSRGSSGRLRSAAGSTRSASTTPSARGICRSSNSGNSYSRRVRRGRARAGSARSRETAAPTQQGWTPDIHRRPRAARPSRSTDNLSELDQGNVPVGSRGPPVASFQYRNDRSETHDQGSQSNPDGESLGEVVMAVDVHGRSTIGCAYYVARNEAMYFMEDSELADVSLLDACPELPQCLGFKLLTKE